MGCTSSTPRHHQHEQNQKIEEASGGGLESHTHEEEKPCPCHDWGYEVENGPKTWHKNFEAANGVTQSPINISSSQRRNAVENNYTLSTHYNECSSNIQNNGHTVQWSPEGAGHVMFNGQQYNLLQFHFHVPSEHTFDSENTDIEIHFVHQHVDTGELLVIGHCFNCGVSPNAFVENITSVPVLTSGQKSDCYVDFGLMDFATEYIHYDGSLTTPPCAEGVLWFVSKEVSSIHKDQLSWFTKSVPFENSRPVEPRNGRTLTTTIIEGTVVASSKKRRMPHKAVNWGYEAHNGPATWKHSCPAAKGVRQSPIDINFSACQTDSNQQYQFQTNYHTCHAVVQNNSHTVQWNPENAGCVHYDGKQYDLVQFHFHIPSEHTFGQKHADIEIHFVHCHKESGVLLVVGHCFQKGSANEFIKLITQASVLKKFEEQNLTKEIDFNAFNFETEYVHYDGSLTTPPCSEGVLWFVSKTISPISADQLAWFRACIPFDNARPVQNLNSRPSVCTRGTMGCFE